jgi:tyrosyl-tRNA synthetase
VHYNSQWHGKGLKHILNLAKVASVQQVLKRDDFKKRLMENVDITLLEILYPLLQGYDSVAVKADVEIGGTDQKFNLLMGRRVQRHFGLKEQDILIMPLIEGTDGVRKMSKSYGNYIAINEKPNEMFGKIMSIPDSLIEKYFLLLTDAEPQKNLGPYENKKTLAWEIVAAYYGGKTATAAEEEFIKVFSKKEMAENFPELKVNNEQMEILAILIAAGIKSKSEARRLIDQKAVEINGEVKNNPKEIILLHGGEILKIGKKKFFKIKVKI